LRAETATRVAGQLVAGVREITVAPDICFRVVV
jgi:hypothetical protein